MGFVTEVVFLDFKKAFNSVVDSKLLIKLKGYGIHYELLSWIENFLSNRSYCVTINGECLEFLLVKSSVPQRTVLSPLITLYFIGLYKQPTIDCASSN